MNKKISVLVLMVVCYSLWAHAQPLDAIKVKGNHFVNARGEVIVFNGLDTSDPHKLQKDNHWNKRYFQEMKSWGANIVRFPVHPANWRELGSKAYLQLLDEGIQWATELQLYVIIDWHSIGNLKAEKFFSSFL